jgi:hypothetical protein
MFLRALPVWLAALWWGSLTTIGFLVVPLLFVHLPSPAMAGAMAAKLFSAQTTVSVGCGLILLMFLRSNKAPALVDSAQTAMLFIVGGILLALLVEFGVAPHIVARDNLVLWHRVGTGMYVVQWVCASAVLGRLANFNTAPRHGG